MRRAEEYLEDLVKHWITLSASCSRDYFWRLHRRDFTIYDTPDVAERQVPGTPVPTLKAFHARVEAHAEHCHGIAFEQRGKLGLPGARRQGDGLLMGLLNLCTSFVSS